MKFKKLLLSLAAASCLGLFASAASAQARVVVKFKKGAHSAEARGSIKGYTYIDYMLGAKAGQLMSLEVTSNNDNAELVVLDPDKENVDYGTGVVAYHDTLRKDGNYTVRVLMSRAEARRKGAATTFLVTFLIQ